MDFDLYMNRPLTESLAVELAAGAVTATVACFGARLLSSEKDGNRELSTGGTLVVAGAGLLASWLTAVAVRRRLMQLNP